MEAIFVWMLDTFFTVLQHMLRLPKYVKIVKTLYENRILAIFVVSLLSSLRNDFWMDFGVVLRSKLEPKSTKNSIKNGIKTKMQI